MTMNALGATLIAALLTPGLASAQERWDWQWRMYPMPWLWWAWGLVMMVLMVAFWAAVIAAIVAVIRWLAPHGPRARSDRAVDILRERYARGEIDKQEFDAKLRDLR